jgi:hypothetical protein
MPSEKPSVSLTGNPTMAQAPNGHPTILSPTLPPTSSPITLSPIGKPTATHTLGGIMVPLYV